MAGIFFEDVCIGDKVTPQTVQVDERQLFFYSAATNDGHRIHYDRPWTTDVEGHRDLLVHAGLQAALLAKMIMDWAGPGARLVTLSYRNSASAFPNAPLRFQGRVTGRLAAARDGGIVQLECEEVDADGAVLLPARAEVRVPTRKVPPNSNN